VNRRIQDCRPPAPEHLSGFRKRLWNQTIRDPNFAGFSRAIGRSELLNYTILAEHIRHYESFLAREKLRFGEDWQEMGVDIRSLIEPYQQKLADLKLRLFKRAT